MSSYLTESEIDQLQASKLPRDTPYLIGGVSHGYFSVARHYGGAKFQGKSYTYLPGTDELIRDDVLKWVTKLRKPVKKVKDTTPPALLEDA